MHQFSILNGDQSRQLINAEQAYLGYRAARAELDQRYRGSMTWKTVRGADYLYRKANGGWRSLGRRNTATENSYTRFYDGRAALKKRLAKLDETVRRMAPVNRAMRLGRVPWIAARLLRKLDREQLLGSLLSVAGTHALYAYERMAGVHFASSHVATQDIDLLFDGRRHLRLLSSETQEAGLAGLLRSIDEIFQPLAPGAYRAVNREGFMVDLIGPMARQPATSLSAAKIGEATDDMNAAEIEGLVWLQNSPAVEQVVIDERGYPLLLLAPDPRAFALHKLWVSERPDRDRLKARRDMAQARAVAALLITHLPHLRFDDLDLGALPAFLRAKAPELLAQASGSDAEREDW